MLLLSSCEKMVLTEETDDEQIADVSKANLVLRVSDFLVVPYDEAPSRSVVAITDYCTRFNFVLYQNGKKVKAVSQYKTDADYGQVALELEPGTYQLLVLAHSGSKGNPSLANPEAIAFDNVETGYSDTFYYYGDIEVTAQSQTHAISLTRATTLLQLNFDETYPEDFAILRVYYTGGSGVLNVTTGYGGAVNSRQQQLYTVSSRVKNQDPFTAPVYTFLQQDEGTLNVKIAALNANQEVLLEKEYTDVPVKHRHMTVFQGHFFNSQNDFTFTAETAWDTAATVNY